MSPLPDRKQQIISVHAPFIRQVVELSQDQSRQEDLETLLRSATENGWARLVRAVREILKGRRDDAALQGLDEEDTTIAEAILRGLQNPASLPPREPRPDPTLAAPGLASMIQAAGTGDVRALRIVSEMADQMRKTGGPMARLSTVIRPLINGERDPHTLCKGMDGRTEQLVLDILAELGKSGRH
jgi:hypothetical protein